MIAQRETLQVVEAERGRLAKMLESEGSGGGSAHALAKKDELISRLTTQLDFLNGKFEELRGLETGAVRPEEKARLEKVALAAEERASVAEKARRGVEEQ